MLKHFLTQTKSYAGEKRFLIEGFPEITVNQAEVRFEDQKGSMELKIHEWFWKFISQKFP